MEYKIFEGDFRTDFSWLHTYQRDPISGYNEVLNEGRRLAQMAVQMT